MHTACHQTTHHLLEVAAHGVWEVDAVLHLQRRQTHGLNTAVPPPAEAQ